MAEPIKRAPTVQQLRDYFEWQLQLGRGNWAVGVDPTRLLCSATICQYVGLTVPPPGRETDQGKQVVFLSPILEDVLDVYVTQPTPSTHRKEAP